MSMARELTREERNAIRKLVVYKCSNYDSEYGCLPLEDYCYMLGLFWTGAYCKYFRDSVLPEDPALEASLLRGADMRRCAFCGGAFPEDGKKTYCSKNCASGAKKTQQRGYMRKRRQPRK